jgi:hypothetical protein
VPPCHHATPFRVLRQRNGAGNPTLAQNHGNHLAATKPGYWLLKGLLITGSPAVSSDVLLHHYHTHWSIQASCKMRSSVPLPIFYSPILRPDQGVYTISIDAAKRGPRGRIDW